MKENNMHPSIRSRIMAFYELQWQYNSVKTLISYKSFIITIKTDKNIHYYSLNNVLRQPLIDY